MRSCVTGEVGCAGTGGESESDELEDADSTGIEGGLGRGQRGGGLHGANEVGLCFLVLDFLGGDHEFEQAEERE